MIVGSWVVLNQFTAPAFVMAASAAILSGLLYGVFQDSLPKPKKKGKPSEPTAALTASDISAAKYLIGAPSDVSLRYLLIFRGTYEGLFRERAGGGRAKLCLFPIHKPRGS